MALLLLYFEAALSEELIRESVFARILPVLQEYCILQIPVAKLVGVQDERRISHAGDLVEQRMRLQEQ
jgi:hypothetical protein